VAFYLFTCTAVKTIPRGGVKTLFLSDVYTGLAGATLPHFRNRATGLKPGAAPGKRGRGSCRLRASYPLSLAPRKVARMPVFLLRAVKHLPDRVSARGMIVS